MPDKTPAALGQRVRECMASKGIRGPSELYRRVVEALTQQVATNRQTKRQTITRQTVSNWIGGKVYPSMDMLPILAAVLGTEEEWLLFGSRRGGQIREEKLFLMRTTEEEARLLTAYREASKEGQKTILKLAAGVAEDHPAPNATVHPLRRKDDRIKG